MLFKLIAFLGAALPVFLFIRTVLLRRSTRTAASLKEFKRQLDYVTTVFLVAVGCVLAYAVAEIVWSWL